MGNSKSKGGRGATSKVGDEVIKEIKKEVKKWSETILEIEKNQNGEGANICVGDLSRRMRKTSQKITDYVSSLDECQTDDAGSHSSKNRKGKHSKDSANQTKPGKQNEGGACSVQDPKENIHTDELITQMQTEQKLQKENMRLQENSSGKVFPEVNERQNNARLVDNTDKTIQQLKMTENGLRQENVTLSDKIKSQNTTIQTIQQAKSDLQAENDILRQRLSKLAGDKLTLDNPNITDLSESNRPTKLGEMYSELYDNEWTDAFESMTEDGGYKDGEAIKALRKTLDSAYTFCERNSNDLIAKMEAVAKEMFEDITRREQSLTLPHSPLGRAPNSLHALEEYFIERHWKPKQRKEAQKNWNRQTLVPPAHMEQELKKMRKGVSVSMVPVVQQAYLRHRWDKECIESLKPFIKKSLFICWMMVVQTPPMVFDSTTEPDSRFDSLLYRQYTASGDTIEYVVWPAMFLHEKGSLVLKGVAQPKKRV
ncbi:uncharacterized protein LOC128228650 isoform X2 [Mya arenaria]|uniref:uncharacterized protein LOC128228650 isoform X2 n=1 Tax=Mya arenaria TaxID=6604 RepID=UPI0022E5D4BF|nr:uncharacterized protein LOC128228650 isoform X2 [Mya arenaria]